MISDSESNWDSRYSSTPSVWSLEPNEFVVQELSDLPVGKMADVAGGEGRNALWFASRGWQVENVEFSKVALEKFVDRAKTAGHTELVTSNLADATSAKLLTEPTLSVVAYLQLPWVDLEKALDNLLVQQSSGVIFGVWHGARNLVDGYGGPQSEAMLVSEAQLKDWAEKHGLTVKVRERLRTVKTDAGDRQAIDVTLFAQLFS
jgi:hypothetical protein